MSPFHMGALFGSCMAVGLGFLSARSASQWWEAPAFYVGFLVIGHAWSYARERRLEKETE